MRSFCYSISVCTESCTHHYSVIHSEQPKHSLLSVKRLQRCRQTALGGRIGWWGLGGGRVRVRERDFCSLVRNDFPLLPTTPSRRAPRLQEPWILNIHAGGILPCVGGSRVCRDRRECVKYRSLLLLSLFALCLAVQPNSQGKKGGRRRIQREGCGCEAHV